MKIMQLYERYSPFIKKYWLTGIVYGLIFFFFVSLYYLPFEMNKAGGSDDLSVINHAIKTPVHVILKNPYPIMESFYRPLVSILSKFLYFKEGAYPYRMFQIVLILCLFMTNRAILKTWKVSHTYILLSYIVIISSPFASMAITWWADIGSLINMLMLSLCFLLISKGRTPIIYTIPTMLLALLSKELGIIISIIYLGYYWFSKKKMRSAFIALSFIVLYFFVRYLVLESFVQTSTFTNHIVLFGKYTNGGTLNELYGDFPYPIYIYNVLSQFLSSLFSQPINGWFQFSLGYKYLIVAAQASSSALVIGYLYVFGRKNILKSVFIWILLAWATNILVSYQYPYWRNLPLVSVCFSILLPVSISYLNKYIKNQNVLILKNTFLLLIICVFTSWFIIASKKVVFTQKLGENRIQYYRDNPTPNSQLKVYHETRNHYLKP